MIDFEFHSSGCDDQWQISNLLKSVPRIQANYSGNIPAGLCGWNRLVHIVHIIDKSLKSSEQRMQSLRFFRCSTCSGILFSQTW